LVSRIYEIWFSERGFCFSVRVYRTSFHFLDWYIFHSLGMYLHFLYILINVKPFVLVLCDRSSISVSYVTLRCLMKWVAVLFFLFDVHFPHPSTQSEVGLVGSLLFLYISSKIFLCICFCLPFPVPFL
jgi:hypothetical protein